MIRNLCFSTAVLLLALLASCNKDDVITDGGPKPVITLDNPDGIYPVKVGKSVTIAPTVENAEGAVYAWILDDEPAGSGPTFTFEAREAGIYFLVFRVETPNGKAEEELRIEVNRLLPPEISFPVGDDRVMEGKPDAKPSSPPRSPTATERLSNGRSTVKRPEPMRPTRSNRATCATIS